MPGIKNLPITIQDLLEKIERFSELHGFKTSAYESGEHHEVKIFNTKLPGLLRIYTTAKGITIDGSGGKNRALNALLIDFIREVTAQKDICETRESFKQVSEEVYHAIRDQIYNFFGNSDCFNISKDEPTSQYILECHTVTDLLNKEQVHLDYFTTGTLYIRGFSWYIGEEILNIALKVTGKVIKRRADVHNVMVHACHEDFILDDRLDCKSCENSCRGNQAAFMRRIHYGSLDRYPCSRVADYYFSRYSYRYAYEFECLLDKYSDVIHAFNEWNMLSVGCGPCTDLLGALSLKEKYLKPINYNGIDLNSCWDKIHGLFMEKLSVNQVKLKFHNADIFQFVENINPKKKSLKTNIVSFQYVLSDMSKYHAHSEIIAFMDRLGMEVFEYLPYGSLIIFNDINRKSLIYPLYEAITESFAAKGYLSNRWCFDSNLYSNYETSEVITTCTVQDEIPIYIEKKYNPWVRCKSAALVLRKGKL